MRWTLRQRLGWPLPLAIPYGVQQLTVDVTVDKVKEVQLAIRALANTRVMVGIPSDKAARKGKINNAQLGYIHEFGAPEVNIPPRPFLVPGVQGAQDST